MHFKVFVIHVKNAFEREKHIRKELDKHGFDYEFMLKGDMSDLTPAILNSYFYGQMNASTPFTSCCLKHFYVYEEIIRQKIDYALIFEDDIMLKQNFKDVLTKSLDEIKKENLSSVLISFENSNHLYIKKSEVIENKVLYQKKSGRCAGAYLIDRASAQVMMDEVEKNKCNLQVDWFHNYLCTDNKINIYWTYPHVAEQGSHSGAFASLIDNKKTGYFRKFVYYMQEVFKK